MRSLFLGLVLFAAPVVAQDPISIGSFVHSVERFPDDNIELRTVMAMLPEHAGDAADMVGLQCRPEGLFLMIGHRPLGGVDGTVSVRHWIAGRIPHGTTGLINRSKEVTLVPIESSVVANLPTQPHLSASVTDPLDGETVSGNWEGLEGVSSPLKYLVRAAAISAPGR